MFLNRISSYLVSILLLNCAQYSWGKYSIPEIKIEAFKPRGFRVSIPDENGIRLFAFHGRINGILKELEMGELNKDVTAATDNFWVYENSDEELRVGDYIGYWVFVQHNYFGYRKDNLRYDVKELVEKSDLSCPKSETIVDGKPACGGSLLFDDEFERIDDSNWILEKYIPINGPNYEFNYYSPDSIQIDNSNLKITPVAKQNEMDIRGTLDLTQGCTSSKHEECYYTQRAAFYLPPVQSGKLKSKYHFKYGTIEIVAKLPCGDWIIPEISLIPINENPSSKKIIIAYSRGNKELTANDGTDIGGKLLFAGPVSSLEEPKKSEYLKTKLGNDPFCEDIHTYKIVWKPTFITNYIDRVKFGETYMPSDFPSSSEVAIHLGISVGGILDFPNDFTSGKYVKPWKNKDVRQIKNFFEARNQWLQTWTNLTSALIIDSIKIYAL